MNKDTSKQWFETGDKPTQAQFYQVFDWLRWNDESIAIADVAGLLDIINALSVPVEKYTVGAGQDHINYTVPVGYVNPKIYIVPSSASATTVTDTDNAVDLYAGFGAIDPAKGVEVDMAIFAPTTVRNIYVGTLPVGSVVYVVKQKIF